jgi:SMC interacting uncharacterized protein involved in chromosome segregation
MEGETKYVTWDVHSEYVKRVDAENERQNERLTALERGLQEIGKITANVEVLATNIQAMTDEIKKQGARLEAIEQKPAKRWDAMVGAIITGIVGLLIGLISAGVIK